MDFLSISILDFKFQSDIPLNYEKPLVLGTDLKADKAEKSIEKKQKALTVTDLMGMMTDNCNIFRKKNLFFSQ